MISNGPSTWSVQTAELRFRPVLDTIDEGSYQAAVTVGESNSGGGAGAEGTTEAIETAEVTEARFALTSDAGANQEAVLAQYDPDRNIMFRHRLGPTGVTGEALEGADSRFDTLSGWFVAPKFRSGASGIDLFNALGEECFMRVGTCPTQRVAIEIDNEVVSAPVIQQDEAVFSPFERSNITITGGFTQSEAEDLALVLDFGALPVELEAQQSRIVSASLGTDALDAGIVAGIIGLILVSLYLLAYYRLLGLVAIMSLAISGALLWTIIAWLGESQGLALTLVGVTGLIVAIGVSVDSNVVYFEHLKEDVRAGRTVRSAVDRVFPIAFSTIVKADVASLIAAAVLYFLTVGQVRGFALYLGVATILDLVATYFFMGPAIWVIAHRRVRGPTRPASGLQIRPPLAWSRFDEPGPRGLGKLYRVRAEHRLPEALETGAYRLAAGAAGECGRIRIERSRLRYRVRRRDVVGGAGARGLGGRSSGWTEGHGSGQRQDPDRGERDDQGSFRPRRDRGRGRGHRCLDRAGRGWVSTT